MSDASYFPDTIIVFRGDALLDIVCDVIFLWLCLKEVDEEGPREELKLIYYELPLLILLILF